MIRTFPYETVNDSEYNIPATNQQTLRSAAQAFVELQEYIIILRRSQKHEVERPRAREWRERASERTSEGERPRERARGGERERARESCYSF